MLSKLIPSLDLVVDIPIAGITDDSRKVRKGDLFLAVVGDTIDGKKFIPEVAAMSAAAIVCDPPYDDSSVAGVPVFANTD